MELIRKTVNVKDALGWYLTQNEKRTWMEDLHDEETDEITTIERSDVVCGKGTQVNEIIQSLLEQNGITMINVSNIPIIGEQNKSLNLWEVILNVHYSNNSKTRKQSYFVTAECPADAEAFFAEYFELNISGVFELTKVNKIDYNKVIKIYDTERDEYEADGTKFVHWYRCQIYSMIDDEDGGEKSAGMKNLLVQAVSFEKAISAIKAVMSSDEYSSIYNTIKLLQELSCVEVFIPDESVSYYSNNEI